MADYLPNFGSAGFTLAAFVVALLIIVAVHEFGHYIVGRLSGIHPEVFSMGFGPVIWSRVDRFGTRWQIAAIPLGGYVKFLGDADAASMTGAKAGRYSMQGAPLWARASTVAAGPIFNFLFSIVVFVGMAMWYGVASNPLTLAYLPQLPPNYTQELQAGDQILAIDGVRLDNVSEIHRVIDAIEPRTSVAYEIRRDGTEMVVSGPYPETTKVLSVNHDSAAAEAGILEGDVILSIDGQDVWTFGQMIELVTASNGAPLDLSIWRGGDVVDLTLSPRRVDLPKPDGSFETRWLIGVTGGLFFEPATEMPGLLESLGGAVYQVWYIIKISVAGIWAMVNGVISTCNLSSPVGIAEASGAMAAQGAANFISFLGLLSTAVGLLNLFPIPVLDGGHLVFHAYEAVSRKPPSDAALRVLVAFGLSLILSMMALGLANDLFLCP